MASKKKSLWSFPFNDPFKMAKAAKNKEAARAEDIASQTQSKLQEQADLLRQAGQMSPQEQGLRDALLPLLQRRMGMTGEQLFAEQGPLAQQYAGLVGKGMEQPGYMYPDVVGQQTQRALEEGLYPMLAARGINPQSPLAITEGRRETRDVAIQNALNKLAYAQQDISRGGEFGGFTAGLQQQARGEAIGPAEAARQRQFAGATGAAELGSQGYLTKAGILQNQLGAGREERQSQYGDYGKLAGTAIGAAGGFMLGGPPGAFMGAQLGGQLGGGFGGGGQGSRGYGGWDPYSAFALSRGNQSPSWNTPSSGYDINSGFGPNRRINYASSNWSR